jgi:hypothetical protein
MFVLFLPYLDQITLNLFLSLLPVEVPKTLFIQQKGVFYNVEVFTGYTSIVPNYNKTVN